jgi:hypothetical protein
MTEFRIQGHRRLTYDDRLWPVWQMALDADGDSQPIAPSALSQLSDIFLAAGELALSVLGVQQEAGKIAETIEDQTCDFAGKPQLVLRTFVRRLRAAVATRRGQDFAWVSSER